MQQVCYRADVLLFVAWEKVQVKLLPCNFLSDVVSVEIFDFSGKLSVQYEKAIL